MMGPIKPRPNAVHGADTRMNARKPSERQVLGAESRAAILDAAEALMARRGFIGTSISALQAECGLPASSIYWHFNSKEGVLAAVMERGANNFFAKVDSIRIPPATLGRERLRAQLAGASVAIEQHPKRNGAANVALADEMADVLLAMFDGVFLAVQNNPRLRYAHLLAQVAEAASLLAEGWLRPRTRPARGPQAR